MKTSFYIAVYVHLALAHWSLNGVDVRNIVITTHLVPMSIPEASIRDVSLIHCVVSCIGNGTCLSGYYWKGTKQCQLKTATVKRPRDAGKSNAYHFVLRETAAISDRYDYHLKENTWEEAKRACEELPGASLIQIKSKEQQDTARKLVENSRLELIHIGIFHHHGFLPPSAEWKYMDKTVITYSSWADGEPNPKMLTHAALKKDAGYKWAAVGDEKRGGWICDRHPKK